MHSILKLIKAYTLPIAMITGVLSYIIYINIPALDHTHQLMSDVVSIAQPALIFCMLFLAFCKVHPRELRPHSWQLKLILTQILAFVVLAIPAIIWHDMPGRVIIESAMVCMICPTATAASVVTGRLHGNASCVVSYTCVINLCCAVIIPLVIPLLHDQEAAPTDVSAFTAFIDAFSAIIGRVFPLLMLPLLLAFAVRYMMPRLHRWFVKVSYTSFYLWAVALAIALAITTKAIHHSHETMTSYIGIALVSALSCIAQFYLGRVIGRRHGEPIAGAQSLGQKNTAFAIWMAYTFMTPVTALAGGFYAIWHNIINSYQLMKANNHKHNN